MSSSLLSFDGTRSTTKHMYTTMLAGSAVYSVSCQDLESFGVLTGVEVVPGAPMAMRGVMPYRGSFIPVVDIRLLFDQKALVQERRELAETLILRERDHVDWIEELTSSVVNETQFKKTTDPAKCAFGQWYGTFHSSDELLARELKSFESPHAEIHKLGVSVLELAAKGSKKEALGLIDKARTTTLAALLKQFARVRAILTENIREVVAVVQVDNSRLGIVVDSILDIVHDKDLEPLATQFGIPSPFFRSSFQINKPSASAGQKNKTCHLLDLTSLFNHFNIHVRDSTKKDESAQLQVSL